MIETKIIKKMVQQISRRGQAKSGDHRLMHPEREWFICLAIGLLLLAGCSWWSYSQHQRYVTVGQNTIEKTPEIESVYRRSIVDAALKVMAERKEINTTLTNSLLTSVSTQLPPLNPPSSTETTPPITIDPAGPPTREIIPEEVTDPGSPELF